MRPADPDDLSDLAKKRHTAHRIWERVREEQSTHPLRLNNMPRYSKQASRISTVMRTEGRIAFEDWIGQMVAAQVEAEMGKASTEKRLYNVKEAGVYLGRTEQSIRELKRSGRLTAKHVAGRVVFEKAELDAFIDRESE